MSTWMRFTPLSNNAIIPTFAANRLQSAAQKRVASSRRQATKPENMVFILRCRRLPPNGNVLTSSLRAIDLIGWEIVDAHRPNPLMAKLLK